MSSLDGICGPNEVQMHESVVFEADGANYDEEGYFLIDGEVFEVGPWDRNDTAIQFIPAELDLSEGEHVVQVRVSDYAAPTSFLEATHRFEVVDDCEAEVTVEREEDGAEIEIDRAGDRTEIEIEVDPRTGEMEVEVEL